MKKQYLVVSFIISIICVPVFTQAVTAVELQAQIQSLLNQISVLQAQLATLPTPTTTSCPALSRNLYIGIKGTDVSALQLYLSGTGDYTYGEITGYYGPATEAAVQRFQARIGIISYGSPAVTGYGVVGPQTRARLAAVCESTPNTTNPIPVPAFSVSPTYGTVPLTVTFSAPLTDATYTLDFGDGTKQRSFYGLSSSDSNGVNCSYYGCSLKASHSYSSSGTYTAKLSYTTNATGLVTIGTANITVSALPTATTFSATPTSGMAPLTVWFEAVNSKETLVSFGDGQTGFLTPIAVGCEGEGSSCAPLSGVSHTYATPGTYTATNSGRSVTITVTGSNTPLSGSLTVNTNTSTAPVTATISGSVGGSSCSSSSGVTYQVTYGDGTNATLSCGSYNRSHTYSSAGSYTIELLGTNSAGSQILASHTITVSAPTPTSTFSASPTSGSVPLTVTFSGKALDSYMIDFGDGSQPHFVSLDYMCAYGGDCTPVNAIQMANVTHKYNSAGTYTAKMTDANGAHTVTVTVTGAAPSSASFSATPTSALSGYLITFKASTSASFFGGTQINFGDGQSVPCTLSLEGTSCSAGVRHAYAGAGTYTAKFIGLNEGPATTIGTQTITIIPGGGEM